MVKFLQKFFPKILREEAICDDHDLQHNLRKNIFSCRSSYNDQKVALIIDAEPNLIIANKLHALGYIIYGTTPNPQQKSDLEDFIFWLEVDWLDENSVIKALLLLKEQEKKLDVLLINNSEKHSQGAFEDSKITDFTDNLQRNHLIVQSFLPLLQESIEGRIICLSDITSFIPLPMYSKAATNNHFLFVYLKTLNLELKNVYVQFIVLPVLKKEKNNLRSDSYKKIAWLLNDDSVKNTNTIINIVKNNNKRFLYLVGNKLKLIALLRWLLPDRAFYRLMLGKFYRKN